MVREANLEGRFTQDLTPTPAVITTTRKIAAGAQPPRFN